MKTKGMAHYHDQERDRQAWEASIKKRNKIINRLRSRGVKVERVHEKSMDELRKLLKEAKDAL